MKKYLMLFLVSLVLSLFAGSAQAGDPGKIRCGITAPAVPADMTPVLFMKPEILKHYGKSYAVDMISFRGSSPMIAALAAKEIDFGYLAFSSFANAILGAKLDIKIVADLQQDGVPGYFSHKWAVLEESGIVKTEDLRGRTVAVPAFGTGLDLALRVILKNHGLDPKKDLQIVEVGFGNMEPMLRARKIDVGVFIPTLWYKALEKGGVKEIFDQRQGMGRCQMLIHVGRTEFLKKNPKIVSNFFEDYLIWRRYILDPENQEEAARLVAKYTRRSVDFYKPWVFKKGKDFYRDRDGIPDMDALQKNVDLLYEMQFIKKKLDTKQYLNLSYIQAARKLVK